MRTREVTIRCDGKCSKKIAQGESTREVIRLLKTADAISRGKKHYCKHCKPAIIAAEKPRSYPSATVSPAQRKIDVAKTTERFTAMFGTKRALPDGITSTVTHVHHPSKAPDGDRFRKAMSHHYS